MLLFTYDVSAQEAFPLHSLKGMDCKVSLVRNTWVSVGPFRLTPLCLFCCRG